MKQVILLMLVLSGLSTTAQKKIYLDRNNHKADSASAKTYVLVYPKTQTDSVYKIKQFSMSGKIVVEGAFKDESLSVANGMFRNYKVLYDKTTELRTIEDDGSTKFSNLQPKSYLTEEGLILNNKKEGIWKVFYLDGQLKRTENYLNGILKNTSK